MIVYSLCGSLVYWFSLQTRYKTGFLSFSPKLLMIKMLRNIAGNHLKKSHPFTSFGDLTLTKLRIECAVHSF